MAKFPRSKRKMFQIQRATENFVGVRGEDSYYLIPTSWVVLGVTNRNRWGILAYAETKKLARQFIANKRRAMRSREW